MLDIIDQNLILFALSITMVAAGVIIAAFRGDLNKATAYFKRDQHGKRAWGGILMFCVGALVITMILLWASRAVADEAEWQWLSYADIYVGIEAPNEPSLFCLDNAGGPSRYATSNGGIDLSVLKKGHVEYLATYQHHSCALNGDAQTYDAVGIQIRYRIDLF